MVEIVSPRGYTAPRKLPARPCCQQRRPHHQCAGFAPRQRPHERTGLCLHIQRDAGIETMLHYTCRDRNVLSMQSDLLGAASLG
jgi:5,10-methylenetetrahydrofolate reductase